jgi:hypothetical protein
MGLFSSRQSKHDSSQEEIAHVKAVNEFEEERALEDLRAVMQTPSGRRVVWSLLGLFRLFSDKDYTTRSVGLPFLRYLWDNLGDEYLTAQREQIDADKAFISQVRKIREDQEKKVNANPRRATGPA